MLTIVAARARRPANRRCVDAVFTLPEVDVLLSRRKLTCSVPGDVRGVLTGYRKTISDTSCDLNADATRARLLVARNAFDEPIAHAAHGLNVLGEAAQLFTQVLDVGVNGTLRHHHSILPDCL